MKQDLATELGIEAMPDEAQGNMTACLKWAYEVLEDALGPKTR